MLNKISITLLFFIIGFSAKAQYSTDFILFAGPNFSNVSHKTFQDVSTVIGSNYGFFVNFKNEKSNIHFNTGLLLMKKGFHYKGHSYNLDYLTIPLYFATGKITRTMFYAGPELNFLINSSGNSSNSSNPLPQLFRTKSNMDISFSLGILTPLNYKIFFTTGVSFGLLGVFKDKGYNNEANYIGNNFSIPLMLGYKL